MAGYDPPIAAALWRLQDCRNRTLELLEAVDPRWIDFPAGGGGNTIGALLYHIAAIELDWLYSEILESDDYPDEIVALFPHDVREEDGRLVGAVGGSLADHLDRLAFVRRHFLEQMRSVDEADYRRVRSLEPYDVTPEWVLHHLAQHEADHRGQLGEVIQVLSRESSG